MTPGTYLEKRRTMAGYSLTGLARELLMLTGFGTSRAESDFRRLRLTLIGAEQGAHHHSPERIDLIRNFVPLDRHVYFELVDRAEQGLTHRVAGICRNCACSFHDPCHVRCGPAGPLGTSTCAWVTSDLCSACAGVIERAPHPDTLCTPAPPIRQQLRDLGERMARLNAIANDRGEPPMIRLVPTGGERP